MRYAPGRLQIEWMVLSEVQTPNGEGEEMKISFAVLVQDYVAFSKKEEVRAFAVGTEETVVVTTNPWEVRVTTDVNNKDFRFRVKLLK